MSVTELLDGIQTPAQINDAPREVIDRRIVRIEVKTGGTTIVTRFPVPAMKKAIENGTLERLIGDDFEEVASILGMIDAGMTGRLVDVNTPNAQVVITVEHYED